MAGAKGTWSVSSWVTGFQPPNSQGYSFSDSYSSVLPDAGAPAAKQTRIAAQGPLELDAAGTGTAVVDMVPTYRHPRWVR